MRWEQRVVDNHPWVLVVLMAALAIGTVLLLVFAVPRVDG